MRRLLFAANWKMHLGPDEVRAYCAQFRSTFQPAADRETWFFPSAVSLEAAATSFAGLPNTRVGAQDIHWEAKGAFTGATSAALVRAAGGTVVLIGHSERRHIFGDSDEDTARKLRAALDAELLPILCLGETLQQREQQETESVVSRQLFTAVNGLSHEALSRVVIAYEPVWAIGTGRNATPKDAATVHRTIRERMHRSGVSSCRILYGGSVNQSNVAALLGESEIEGVLVGGASLDPKSWAEICGVPPRRV